MFALKVIKEFIIMINNFFETYSLSVDKKTNTTQLNIHLIINVFIWSPY